MNFSRMVCSAVVALVAGVSFQASAADASESFRSTASVVSSCKLEKQGDVNIGVYNPLQSTGRGPEGSGTFYVTCTRGTKVRLDIDQGLNARAGSTCSAPLRSMKGQTGNNLNYNLNIFWFDAVLLEPAKCDGSGEINELTTSDISVVGPAPYQFQLYAQAPLGQNVQVGDFEDTVTVTLTF